MLGKDIDDGFAIANATGIDFVPENHSLAANVQPRPEDELTGDLWSVSYTHLTLPTICSV